MRSSMSFQGKRELLVQVWPRYREAARKARATILDEFLSSTGYARKYAIRLLNSPAPEFTGPITRPRERHYGLEVQIALVRAWSAANFICSKRLVPFLPELVQIGRAHV